MLTRLIGNSINFLSFNKKEPWLFKAAWTQPNAQKLCFKGKAEVVDTYRIILEDLFLKSYANCVFWAIRLFLQNRKYYNVSMPVGAASVAS